MKRLKTYSLTCAAKEDSNQSSHQRSLISLCCQLEESWHAWVFEMHPEKNLTAQFGPKVVKLFLCSTQLSMKFSLLINMKMPTIVGIFIFIKQRNFHAQQYLARKNLQLLVMFDLLAGQISCSAELSMKKVL